MATKKGGNSAMCSVKSEDEWITENDLQTLTRAREIRNDPKRMARVKELAKKRISEIASLAGEEG